MAQATFSLANARALLVIGLPLIGSQLAQFVINLTDTLMVGWYGVEELAALVLANSIIFMLIVVGAGFAWAVMPLVAAAMQQNDSVQARRVTRMGLWASVCYCFVVVPPLMLGQDLFIWLGQPQQVAELAADYIRIAGWGVFPALGVMVLRNYLAALERANVVLWVTLIAAVLNVILNYLLIFGTYGFPELGVRGAAIASLIMQIGSVALMVVYVQWKLPEQELFVRIWRPDWSALGRVFQLGWPIGLANLAEVGMFSFSAVMMGWVSLEALAAHGIALQLATASFMVHLGLSQAATVRAGQAYGRHDPDGLGKTGTSAIGLSIFASTIAVAAFLLFPDFLIGLFLDPSDPARLQIIDIGRGLLAAAALFQLADGAQVVALGLLRGVQDTRVPMVYAALGYWAIGAPCAWLLAFPLGLGGVGIWLGLAIGLTSVALLMIHRFWWRALPHLDAEKTAASV